MKKRPIHFEQRRSEFQSHEDHEQTLRSPNQRTYTSPKFAHPSYQYAHRDGEWIPEGLGSRPPVTLDPATQHLVKQELMKRSDSPFDGEPHMFNSWMTLLRNRMKGINLDAVDFLAILSANTIGDPHKIVEQHMATIGSDPRRTLDKLLAVLLQRFGSPIQVCASLTRKLEESPLVRPPSAVQKLSELCNLCTLIEQNMENNPELGIYDISSGQCKVWSKLPENLQYRWRSFGHDYSVNNRGRLPPFKMLVEFLQRHADEMNNPYFWKSNTVESNRPAREARPARSSIQVRCGACTSILYLPR